MPDLSGYEEVPDRIRAFFAKHPEGSLRCEQIEYLELPAYHLNGESCLHIVYHAAAYRTPDDPRPGQGTASEPLPGLTPYTRGSELMNAETSAWGRALVALGFVAKKVASQQEVDARKGAPGGSQTYGKRPDTGEAATDPQKKRIKRDLTKAKLTDWNEQAGFYKVLFERELPEGKMIADVVTKAQAGAVIDRLAQGAIPTGKSDVPDSADEFEQPKLEGGDPAPFEKGT